MVVKIVGLTWVKTYIKEGSESFKVEILEYTQVVPEIIWFCMLIYE